MDNELLHKLKKLKNWLEKAGSVAVAFSGGVDSSLLLDIAHDVVGERAVALTVRSAFTPGAEMAEAAQFCESRSIGHIVVDFDPLKDVEIAANAPTRCYTCKRAMFARMLQEAERHKAVLVEGTNTDDLGDFRPGLKALEELGIESPLLSAGLSKQDIRELSRLRKLPSAEKPSAACLASRIPYGTTITAKLLAMVDAAEGMLRERGYECMRVRVHGDPNQPIARIEVSPQDIVRIAHEAAAVTGALREVGFTYVTLDLEGYRMGSLNETIRERTS